MPLNHQKSVLNKHLASQDAEVVKAAYARYSTYFLNKAIQENIRNSKEEQFQEGFLRELFVNILGYTINPNPDFNLTTELKNIKDAKKTDGAILKPDGAALAVIELKGTDTKDLAKVNDQAFSYKNNQPDCVYVITSNFEKLRFFIDNVVDHEEFNLFTLTEQRFALLWLYLQKDNLLAGVPAKVKEESLLQEDKITKALYSDYSAFKNDLWNDMVQQNPQHDPLLLYKKSQKLLDRFLFIFFSEDKGLLPPNSISSIVDQWSDLKDRDAYSPLYSRFKKYFGYMNDGFKGKFFEIHAYNGGLFKQDELLDSLLINDALLQKHCLKITNYDFADEVDTNILGHIFEHSLNDIENVRAQLAGEEVDKSKTKRKKDGVFYTPKYITKYIVDNTVGKLCEEKKAEIGIDDEEFAKDRKGRKKDTIRKLDGQLKQYREWLLQLTICDPACGSGAFLNQALEFLMAEYRYVDELDAQLFEGSIVFQDVENHILENNIYGVDINEESVEIARLSLWLRTAQKGRKLNSLGSNIKCGNSLIDDPEVAGDLAFNWQKEFPQVFQEKHKTAWHITTATHDSRTSQRMIDHKVRLKRDGGTRPKAEPIWLEEADEILIAVKVAEVVQKDHLNVLAFNICRDHMHLLLVCDSEEMNRIVGKIKSITSRAYNIDKGITIAAVAEVQSSAAAAATRGHDPLPTLPHPHALWTQKFGKKEITSNDQLQNTINYIENNRVKHNLPHSKPLQNIIDNFCCSMDHAFMIEYSGGFDVVIGNPPYVRQELITPFKPFLEKHYKTFAGTADLYTYFIEMGVDKLIHDKGLYSIIVGNKWMRARFATKLRSWMKEKEIIELIDFGDLPVFENVSAYPVILTLKKKTSNSSNVFYACEPKDLKFDDLNLLVQNTQFKVDAKELQDDGWSLVNKDTSSLLAKLKKVGVPLTQYVDKAIYYGIKTGFNDAFVIDGSTREELIKADPKSAEIIKPFLAGRDVKQFYLDFQNTYLILIPNGFTNSKRCSLEPDQYLESIYPAIFAHLQKFEVQCRKRYDQGEYWWELRACAYYEEFEKIKIEVASISREPAFSMSYDGHYSNDKTTIIGSASKALLGVLNSSVSYFFIKNTASTKSGGFLEYKPMYISQLPIPKNIEKPELIALVDKIEKELKNVNQTIVGFVQHLQSKFEIEKPSTKLKHWPGLDFKGFLAELNKVKVPQLSLDKEAEWMMYFNKKKAEANALQSEIDRIDKEIDGMVYALYGLTQEEIEIVENS